MKSLLISFALGLGLFYFGNVKANQQTDMNDIVKRASDSDVVVWTDDYTCVQYLIAKTGPGISITPRLDPKGKPVVSTICARRNAFRINW